MTDLLHQELTEAIIGAYFEVYNHTPRIYREAVYERAMLEELRLRGFQTTQQDAYRILYKGQAVGVQQLDLFILGEVVVENKVAERLTPLHKAQALSYLKTVGKAVGLVLNFGSVKPEFDRIYFDPEPKQLVRAWKHLSPQTAPEDWLYPELAYQIVGGLYEVHTVLGPGFVHRIYANACFVELLLRGLAVQPHKRMEVGYKGTPIGDIAFAHLLVEDKAMVFPVAYQDKRVFHLDNLKQWMRQRHIRLGILANFQTSRLDVTFVRT